MRAAWACQAMGDIAPLIRRPVPVRPDETYREIGIRSFGRGVFHKTPTTGLEIGTKRVFSIEPGDLLFNIVFAWEGAVAVASEPERGTIGSHRFLTCVVNKDVADARYLFWWFSRGKGREQLLKASPGGAGRNRTLGVDKLAAIDVPLPPPEEQQRMIAWIERVEAKIAEACRLRNEASEEAEALIVSTHLSLSASSPQQLSTYVALEEEAVPIRLNVPYLQAGVRGFGGGLFSKPPVIGGATTYRSFNRLYPGALVMSQVKGWEGAIAVTPHELVGRYVSPEYRTFKCRDGRCLPEYLATIVPTKFFWSRLKDATRGVGARRERTRPEQFLALEMPMPSVPDQQRALATFDRIRAVQRMQSETTAELQAILPAIIDKAFRGEL